MNLADSNLLLSIMIVVELLLIASLYFCYKIIKSMESDLEYSVTRIFLSERSVKGIKALLGSLMAYAIINLVTVLGTTGELLRFAIRANMLILFGGFMYFFWQISEVTQKK
jgi:hypothetical protein